MQLKNLILFGIAFFIVHTNWSQEDPLVHQINSLKTQIQLAEGVNKLMLLDSLSKITEYSTDYNFENTTLETIELAIAIDSLELAADNIAALMFYKNNTEGVPQDGIDIYKKYKPQLKDFKSKIWDAELHIELADSYYFSGNIDSAFIYYEKAKTYAIQEKDEPFLAYVQLCMGSAYSSIGAFSEASQNLKEAYITFIKVKDTFALIHTKYLLSTIYSKNDFFKEAKIERDEGIRIATIVNDYSKLSSFYSDAARDDKKKNLEKERISHLKKALEFSEKSEVKTTYRVGSLANLAIAYSENDSIKKAKEVINTIEKYPEELNKRNRVYYIDALKHIAFAKGELLDAITYGEEVLQLNKNKESFEQIKKSELFLSEAYEQIGNKNKALEHFKSYTQIKDSIAGVQKTASLAYYQTLYETEKRDQEIKAQKTNITLLEQKSKVRSQWFVIAGILATLLFVIFYLRNRYNQKIEKRIAVEQLRTKISADLHDDVGSLLTGLSMQSEILGKNAPENIRSKLERISLLSRSAMLQMRDSVWIMDARKDNWISLIDRINEFASEHLGAKELTFKLGHTNSSNKEEIEGITRQHLYLVTKEAIANILKHSNASTVAINLEKNNNEILLFIKDNGTTAKEKPSAGLGVSNIRDRIEQLNGKLEISTNNGYQININIPA